MSNQLQNLSIQYNNVLTFYTDTYKKYISSLNSNTNNLITIPDTSFVGKSNFQVINNSSLDNCKNSCITNINCSGASFNNNANSCTLSNGLGEIIFTPQSSSIVQESLYYSFLLKYLNAELISINNEMMVIAKNSYNEFSSTQELNQQKEQILNNNYQTLTQEREEIDEMVRKFETLNAAYENGNLIVTSNYYFYILLLIVTIILIIFFFKFSLLNRNTNGEINWLPLFIIIIILIYLVYLIRRS